MSNGDLREIHTAPAAFAEINSELTDQSIRCMDCTENFIWSAGEQQFFYDKSLQNPPKRCKECKRAKNHRIAAVAKSRLTGRKHHIEIKARCATCEEVTTVPFYPSQGRPVYCRACFVKNNADSNGANGRP